MIHFEQGLNGNALLWQEHFLTNAFADRDVVFSAEPILNPRPKRYDTPFRLDEKGVGWTWRDRRSAHVSTIDQMGRTLSRVDKDPLDEPYLSFSEISGGAWGEITLFQDAAPSTATLKFELPPAEDIVIFRQADMRSVVIEARPGNSLFGLSIEKLKPKSDHLRPSDPPVPPIRPGQPSVLIMVGPKERCYVVVYRRLPGGPKIVRCATNSEAGEFQVLSRIDEADAERLTRYLSRENPVLRTPSSAISNWSDFSTERLMRLRNAVLNTPGLESLGESHIDTHATGLCRTIVLLEIGCSLVAEAPRKYVDSLNNGDFLSSLRKSIPVLKKIGANFPTSIKEQIWVLQHLKHPGIISVVENAGGHGLDFLRREGHLEDMRTAAVHSRRPATID